MSAYASGSLTATGSVTLTKPTRDTTTVVQISGTYGTVTLVIEGSMDGTNFFAVTGVREDTGAVVTGTISPADNATQAWRVPSDGLVNVRPRVTAIASGTAAFALQSDIYSSSPVITQSSTGQTISGVITVTSSSATALAVGPAGATNPTFNVDASTSSAATGLNVKSAAAGSGLAIKVVSSGTNENLTIDAKGSGTVTINATATGALVLGAATGITGALTVTSTSASALTVGANGATNPVIKINANTGSVATGISVTGAAAASGVAIAVISSGTDESVTMDAKGSGTMTLASVSTGNVVIGPTGKLVMAGTLTAGGLVTNAVQIATSGPLVYSGSGAPSISAAVKGSLYLRSDGSSTSTRAYIATDTSGTWTAITTAA